MKHRGVTMAKMQKLYRINLETARTLNIAHFNPTCKAILKAMYRIEKSADSEAFKGTTGEDILKFAVEKGLWSTRQDPSKYHTTWAYYVKKLKEEAGIYEAGAVRGSSTEEFLGLEDEDEELMDEEPNDEAFDEDEELARMANGEDEQQAAA
jgi:hypothetical protein